MSLPRSTPLTNQFRYEYQKVSVQDDVAVEAQNYANQGWRTVAVFQDIPVVRGFRANFQTTHLLLERTVSLGDADAPESHVKAP